MKEGRIKMKHSIRLRLILTITALIFFTVFLCWFMNLTLLNQYYQYTKVKSLGSVYTEINDLLNSTEHIVNESTDSEVTDSESIEKALSDINLMFERLDSNSNMTVYIADIYKMGHILIPQWLYPLNLSEAQSNQIITRIYDNYYETANTGNKSMERLANQTNYDIYKVFDKRLNSNYIELYGNLESGPTIYIRTNLETIQESVSVANKFLANIGLVAAAVGVVIMYFISKSFTKPVLELSEIAKKISQLDFNIKYQVEREDEIGTLGNSINLLSDKLEHTISELKRANNELMSDIENKIQIDEMRKEFLSNVSHELKTPIALIQGYAEGLKDNINEDEESREFYCEVIIDEAFKMNKMVKKLLSLNQIESGNNQMNIERFDIGTVIRSVLSSTDILFQQKNAKLLCQLQESLYAWADEYMVEEVFTNYISNALNHVKEGGNIEVKMVQKEKVVRISVFNEGEPIPEQDLDNVWIKFYKVDKARTREYGGSGRSVGQSVAQSVGQSFGQ